MSNKSRSALQILHHSKYLGLALILFGIPTIIMDDSSGSEIPLLVGLFTLFVTTDRNEDERSAQIKTTSLFVAFTISYGAKLITTNLHDHELISFELAEINHFLILTLTLANLVFFGRLYILKD